MPVGFISILLHAAPAVTPTGPLITTSSFAVGIIFPTHVFSSFHVPPSGVEWIVKAFKLVIKKMKAITIINE